MATFGKGFRGFWIEKRGKMHYGFCDDACPVIIRDNYWKCIAAMESHRREQHGGQLSLLLSVNNSPLNPDDPPPF